MVIFVLCFLLFFKVLRIFESNTGVVAHIVFQCMFGHWTSFAAILFHQARKSWCTRSCLPVGFKIARCEQYRACTCSTLCFDTGPCLGWSCIGKSRSSDMLMCWKLIYALNILWVEGFLTGVSEFFRGNPAVYLWGAHKIMEFPFELTHTWHWLCEVHSQMGLGCGVACP